MIRIVIIEDSDQRRRLWEDLIAGFCPSVNAFAPALKSSEAFIAVVSELIEREDVLGVDGVVLDMQLTDGSVKEELGGERVWRELKERHGREALGELLVASKFADEKIAHFAASEGGLACHSEARSHRKAALLELLARIEGRNKGLRRGNQ